VSLIGTRIGVTKREMDHTI